MELLDLCLQYFCQEVLGAIIDRVSRFLTKIFVNSVKKTKYNYSEISKLVLLYRSHNFLLINKPPDILINSDDPTKISVQTILRKQFPELIDSSLAHEFYFPHRLDYSTSGILCIPLNKQACAATSHSFEKRISRKYYIALLNGVVLEPVQIIDLDIGEDSRYELSSKRMCSSNEREYCKNSRTSVTRLVVIERGYYLKRPATKVLLMLVTGRRHQLRVHCKAIGHPIVGDYTYGLPEDKALPRMFLHAIRLEVPNCVEDVVAETGDPFNGRHFKDWKPNIEYRRELKDFYDLLEELN